MLDKLRSASTNITQDVAGNDCRRMLQRVSTARLPQKCYLPALLKRFRMECETPQTPTGTEPTTSRLLSGSSYRQGDRTFSHSKPWVELPCFEGSWFNPGYVYLCSSAQNGGALASEAKGPDLNVCEKISQALPCYSLGSSQGYLKLHKYRSKCSNLKLGSQVQASLILCVQWENE